MAVKRKATIATEIKTAVSGMHVDENKGSVRHYVNSVYLNGPYSNAILEEVNGGFLSSL